MEGRRNIGGGGVGGVGDDASVHLDQDDDFDELDNPDDAGGFAVRAPRENVIDNEDLDEPFPLHSANTIKHPTLSMTRRAAGGVKGADDRSIRCVDELRLMLLRHWSLAEALSHSAYVATRMGVWKEKGRQKIGYLLAKMG